MAKILIVEDEVYRRELLKDILAKANRNDSVYMAPTYKSGLELIRAEKFDFILLDHDLGDLHYQLAREGKAAKEGTGYELAKEIKKSKNKDAFVVVHSLNPVGVANIQSVLPKAIACPVYNVYTRWEEFRQSFGDN